MSQDMSPDPLYPTANHAGGDARQRWATACGEVATLGALKRFYSDCIRAKVGTPMEERTAMVQTFRLVTGRSGAEQRRMYEQQPGALHTKCWRDPARVVELMRRTHSDISAAFSVFQCCVSSTHRNLDVSARNTRLIYI